MFKDKIRTMVRSVLPSKARVSARQNQKAVRRTHRRAVKVALFRYDHEDDFDDTETVYKLKTADLICNRKTSFNIRERRDGDKVNHFVRWAKNKTKHLPDARSKYYYMIGLMGGSGNVIKDHAMTHFISPADFGYEVLHGELWRLTTNRKYFYLDEPLRSKPMRPIAKDIFLQKLIEGIQKGLEPQLNQILRDKFGSLVYPLGKPCTKNSPCFEKEMKEDWEGKLKEYIIHNRKKCVNRLKLNGIKTCSRIVKLLYRFPRFGVIWEMWNLLEEKND